MYRYLGNKTRLTDWIVDVVGSVLPDDAAVADLMCGTASVSVAFAERGYRVIAADQLTFPVLHAEARLLHASAPDFSSAPGGTYASAIEALNQAWDTPGFFFREYSSGGEPENGSRPRAYFTPENAAHIDGVRKKLRGWLRRKRIGQDAYRLLLHDLILAANRVANIAGTYGYYRSSWSQAALRPLELRASDFDDWASHKHQVIQGPVEEVVAGVKADAIYLDPPYTKRQYAGNYHILETLARNDEPEPQGEGGLRPWAEDSSAFCYRRSAPGAFRAVVEACSAEHVFISYSEDGQVPASNLLALLQEYGDVERHEMDYQRYQSNARAQGGALREHLYHVRRT